jgi:hypothetical protein
LGQSLFLYDFEFIPYENPPRTKERFTEDLRAFFESHDLDYGMSALGGMVHTRGDVRGRERPVSEDDRQALARWAKAQPVRCKARLGALEEDREGIDFFRDVIEWVFQVDNLTESDRAEAVEYHQRTRDWVRRAQEGQS